MPQIPSELLQLGAVAVIFLFCAREFFIYLKNKKLTNGKTTEKAILDELQLQNQNHLIHISESIERLSNTIRDGNIQIVALLSEIKGILSK